MVLGGFMTQLDVSSSFHMLCLLRGSGDLGGGERADTVDKATKAHYLDLSTDSVRLRRRQTVLDLPVRHAVLPRVPV